MENNKELLEATVKGLQEKVEQLTKDLEFKRKELDDVNKPKLNQSTMDIIYDCIDDGIHEFNFNCDSHYDFEYEIDYDGRVSTHHIEFNSTDYVKEPIIKLIEDKFNIINDIENENNE